jgi:hypothetical protein
VWRSSQTTACAKRRHAPNAPAVIVFRQLPNAAVLTDQPSPFSNLAVVCSNVNVPKLLPPWGSQILNRLYLIFVKAAWFLNNKYYNTVMLAIYVKIHDHIGLQRRTEYGQCFTMASPHYM